MIKKSMKRMVAIILITITLLILSVSVFLSLPSFGQNASGQRLERILKSPNYRNGKFHNQHFTHLMTGDSGKLSSMVKFLFGRPENVRPDSVIPVKKSDIRTLSREDQVIWFGHSSYLLQLNGVKFLVDPVFYKASPVSFINRPFKGPDIFRPSDIPDIDVLVITHDHWDHLDCRTVKEMKNRIGLVVCPLGVGAHFERWGYEAAKILEFDWYDSASLDNGTVVHCLSARHFSGRGLKSNTTLWASFLIETPQRKVFLAGDGGYDSHFAEIGKLYPDIDLAVMENGQYNEDWKYIHLMPQQMHQAVKDLNARRVLTVHHSKYALSRHHWREPLENIRKMKADSISVLDPCIGEIVKL